MKLLLPLALSLTALVGLMSAPASSADRAELIFISSFADAPNGAIHAFRLDPASGKLTATRTTTGIEHPFFMALSPDRRFLYAIHAPKFSGPDNEFVAAYSINGRDGELKLLGRQSSRGTASCYLSVDATGKCVLLANYTTGSVAAFPVQADGSLGEAASFVQHAGKSVDPARQEGPHAHSFVISPDNRHAYAADLGLDKILCYRLDPSGARVSPNSQPFVRTPPGAGPRHLLFHPNGKHLYAINEMGNSVTLYDFEARSGMLIERQTISTVPDGFDGKSACADLKITADGRYLYGTNRGHDSIAAYRLADDGTLTRIGIFPSLGKGPQNLAIVANGRVLLCANMAGDNVAAFRIDPQSGALTPLGEPLAVPAPSCIREWKE